MVARSHNWLAASFESIPPEELPTLSSRLQQIAQVLRGESARQLRSDQTRNSVDQPEPSHSRADDPGPT